MDIDRSKSYSFPTDIKPVNYSGFLLLISPSNGNWIVLENQKQVEIAKYFANGKTINEINELFSIEEKDFQSVLNEIEGRHFCERMVPEESEFTLRIYLTNDCNLRCKHCFMYAEHSLENELSYEEIIELLDKSKSAGCNKVIFTGGEVVLKDRFVEILSYARGLDLYVQVLTNGVLWNENMIREVSNYVDEVQVSIDGFDDITNSEIRGKGTFSKSISTIEHFINEGKVFVSVITTPLYDYIDKFKEQYIRFGKEMIERFDTEKFLVIFGRELIDGRAVKADVEKNKKMSSIVDDIYKAIYPNAELTTFIVNHKNNRIFMNCGYGGLTVNSNGDFYFCGRVHEVKSYGNIRRISFQEILQLRKKAREKTYVDNIVPCKDCDIRLICGGGCRVSNIPEITHIDLNRSKELFERGCDILYKENIYKLMVGASEYLYW